MTNWQELEARYFFTNVKRMPVTIVRGEGTRLWDDTGKEYLDFFAGHATTSLGHCHPVVVEALTDQARTFIHYSNVVYSTPQVQLAQLLVENSVLDRVFFCNSGAEAVEGALKLARKWGKEKKGGAYEIISALNSFHGRTMAAVTATGNERYKSLFAPLPEGFINVPFNDIDAIKGATNSRTCAILLEPVQGEGGVNVPDDDYLRQVRAWCDENNILLILDEVQTGIGRLGTLFGYEMYGVEPDIMTLAKGLGGGVPIGCFMAKEFLNILVPGDHGSTFGGSPLATRVGHAVLKYVIDNDISGQVARKGELVLSLLRSLEDKYPFVTEIRGKGLLWAIELNRDAAEQVARDCLENGVIVNNVKASAIRLAPPLTISEDELREGISRIDRALAKLA